MHPETTVANIIRKHLDLPVIASEDTFGGMGADSLDIVEIAIAIETEFGLSTDAFDDWGFDTTVAEAIADVEAELALDREAA
jgi:acyl carrier protein